MNDILIVVEGDADVVFLMQYLFHLNLCKWSKYEKKKPIALAGNNGTIRIIATNGKDNIKEQRSEIEKAIDNEYKVIFIFDADKDVSLSRANILKQWSGVGLSAGPEIFLFPNDRDSGTLEDLLLKCVHSCNVSLRYYWQTLSTTQLSVLVQLNSNYSRCSYCRNTRNFYDIDSKTVIYQYAYQLTEDKAKEVERDYSDKKVWDLESKALEPLRDFLLKNI